LTYGAKENTQKVWEIKQARSRGTNTNKITFLSGFLKSWHEEKQTLFIFCFSAGKEEI